MTDEQHAKAIRTKASELNHALRKASESGLRIEVRERCETVIGDRYPCPMVDVTIERPNPL